ncbi:TolC family protein [Roseimaritima ulvae]|nr:TolC family protein [Roseimaritima ulvae]
MHRRSWTLANKPAQRLVLAATIAASATGCATPGGGATVASTTKTVAAPPLDVASVSPADAPSVAANDVPQPHEAAEPLAAPVQPVGFNDGIIVASPTDLAHLHSAPTAADQDSASSPNPDSQTPTGQSVEYFVDIALARHPKILAARQRVAAATNVIPQARALPDPTFNNTFWPLHDNAIQTAAGRVANQMSVNQKVPYPEKLKTQAVIASREVQIAQAEVDAIAREITEAVRLAYYEVWFATRAISIVTETKDLVADLEQVAEARYRSGGSQQDVLRARLETDRLDDELVTLTKQQQLAQADLATLLQQPLGTFPATSSELDIRDTPRQLEELVALAEQCNPQLQGLGWEIQRDRGKERLACLQQYPDINVGLAWGLVSDNNNVLSPVANGNDQLSFSIGTTLPIWRDKINAGVREAAHRRSSTTRRLEAERDELYGKIRRLVVQAEALNQQRDIYQNRIIPRTESTLKLSIADYRGKRTDFFTLVETYRELLMFETQLARIDATLAGTLAQLDRTVGCGI